MLPGVAGVLRVVDLFAGAGGWDLAAERVGLTRPLGYEHDPIICQTRHAAGLRTKQTDLLTEEPVRHIGQIASPPCKSFSTASGSLGRRYLDAVLDAIDKLAHDPKHRLDGVDPNTALVIEPLRWALVGEPTWIAWEQVPGVLVVWEACAEVLRDVGYSVVTGRLDAEQYGVAQTRKRAFLVAHASRRDVMLPAPIHSKYVPAAQLNGKQPTLGPWMSMGRVLDWDFPNEAVVTSNYYGSPHVDPTIGKRPRGYRKGTEPFATITSKARAFKIEHPHRKPGLGPALSLGEASLLQGFPEDFPWQGLSNDRWVQVGNAVPVRLAEAVLREVACDE